MPGSVRDDADGDYVCTWCSRNQCHRCTERACECCSGVPEDAA